MIHSPTAAGSALVVCETRPRYAIAARQALGEEFAVVETRHLDDAWQALRSQPHGLLVVEAEVRRAPQLVALLSRIRSASPHVMAVACGAGSVLAWELLLREAGAAMFLRSPREVPRVASWWRRHLALAPAPPYAPREQIWRRLPWASAAHAAAPSETSPS